ncbi:MAG: hypothetical protein SOT46_08410 [Treponema sp.]|nr:hypothetical protein [Spirochaetia bacterium]MDY2840371.1 hypothetical protein [Treponema sp.]
MKKALKILLVYLAALIVSLIIGTFFYSLFISVSNYVYGYELKFLSQQTITDAFFYVLYFLIFIICPFIAYYRIRHIGGVPQTLFYILICLINWLILFPGTIKLEEFYLSKNKTSVKEISELSPGYFRNYNDDVVYFLDNDTESENVIFIDKSEGGKVSLTDKKHFYEKRIMKSAAPFKEIQIKENFHQKGISLFVNLDTLITQGKQAYNKGISFFLGFLSIALALCSLYGMSNFLKWRATNACFDILCTVLILTVNTYVYRGYYGVLIFKIMRLNFLTWMIDYVDQPVLVVLNILIALVFTVIGIVKFIIRKAKKA